MAFGTRLRAQLERRYTHADRLGPEASALALSLGTVRFPFRQDRRSTPAR